MKKIPLPCLFLALLTVTAAVASGPHVDKYFNLSRDQVFLSSDANATALAVEQGDITKIKSLGTVKVGYSSPAEGLTYTFWALRYGQVEVFEYLLSNTPQKNPIFETKLSLLDYAAAQSDPRYLEIMAKQGVDLNSKNGYGQSSFKHTLLFSQPDNAKFMLEHGLDPNTSNSVGKTLLTTAILMSGYQVANYLLDAGADPSIRDSTDSSSIDWLLYIKKRGMQTRDVDGFQRLYDRLVALGYI